MYGKISSPQLYAPSHLQEALSYYYRNPNALLYAGGTYILEFQTEDRLNFPPTVLSLENVEELKRMARTNRYIEIGAGASISRIASIGPHVLPYALYKALLSIGSPGIRNMATLVGNICVPEKRLNCFPVLSILNSQIEIRSLKNTRWIPMNKFVDIKGNLALEQGELVTRIRIPMETWNFQAFRTIGHYHSEVDPLLTFCGLAKVEKGSLSAIRFACSSIVPVLIRNREFETQLMGKQLPFSNKEIEGYIAQFRKTIQTTNTPLSAYHIDSVLELTRNFLLRLGRKGEHTI